MAKNNAIILLNEAIKMDHSFISIPLQRLVIEKEIEKDGINVIICCFQR